MKPESMASHASFRKDSSSVHKGFMALDYMALVQRRGVPAVRWSIDSDLPKCRGAQQEDGFLGICNLECGMVEKGVKV